MALPLTSWRTLKGAQNLSALVGAHVCPLWPGGPIVWPHLLPVRVGARPQPDLASVRQNGRDGDVVSWEAFAELNFVTAILNHVILLSVVSSVGPGALVVSPRRRPGLAPHTRRRNPGAGRGR